jgi:4-hydroxy-3-polyprenylbenzoate decarboxylase
MKLVVAVGGASGACYAKRLLDVLAPSADGTLEVGLCFSNSGRQIWRHEIGAEPDYPFRRWEPSDFFAPFASGSAAWDAMVVIPCSTAGLGRIAQGVAGDLIGRAADVMLKEKRKLILVVRETPLSLIHLDNMRTVAQAGAVVLPASPSFYSKPSSVQGLLDTVIGRVLDQIGIPHTLMPRWGEDTQ